MHCNLEKVKGSSRKAQRIPQRRPKTTVKKAEKKPVADLFLNKQSQLLTKERETTINTVSENIAQSLDREWETTENTVSENIAQSLTKEGETTINTISENIAQSGVEPFSIDPDFDEDEMDPEEMRKLRETFINIKERLPELDKIPGFN